MTIFRIRWTLSYRLTLLPIVIYSCHLLFVLVTTSIYVYNKLQTQVMIGEHALAKLCPTVCCLKAEKGPQLSLSFSRFVSA